MMEMIRDLVLTSIETEEDVEGMQSLPQGSHDL